MVAIGCMLGSLPGVGGDKKDKGLKDPYALELSALKGPALTDVYVRVVSLFADVPVPATADKVQVKALDAFGEAIWTQNYQDVPLTDGEAVLTFADLSRYQMVSVHIQATDPQSVKKQVAKGTVMVLLRPDMAVQSVNAPVQAFVGQIVNIEVAAAELNGDVGAMYDVHLSDGAQLLDSVPGASVAAGGSASHLLAVFFAAAGTYRITATLANVDPADYDEANNGATFEITIVPNVVSVPYTVSYQRTSNFREIFSAQTIGTNRQTTTIHGESMSFEMCVPRALTFPVESFDVDVYADGVNRLTFHGTNLMPTSTFVTPTSRLDIFVQVTGTGDFVQLQSTSTSGGTSETFVNAFHLTNQRVFTSVVFSSLTGQTTTSSLTTGSGTLWVAVTGVQGDVRVKDLGTTFGGVGGTSAIIRTVVGPTVTVVPIPGGTRTTTFLFTTFSGTGSGLTAP
jgi:hypothetical protein